MKPTPSLAALPLALVWLSLCTPALAQYKVVLPDGSVTYTDRPRPDGNARITPLGRSGAPVSTEPTLPQDLRQATQRYPVTLYTTTECAPCESGRKFLQQRGIPFSERRIVSEEDTLAMERAVGGRTVPALTVGAQPMRGYAEADWTAYLDAAGYPRESKLPRNWQNPAPVAMVEKPAPRPAPPPAPEPRRDEDPVVAPAGPRF